MQIQKLVDFLNIIYHIENLLVSDRLVLNFLLIHLINHYSFLTIHSSLLLEFFKLSLSSCIDTIPLISALLVDPLSFGKLLLVVEFVSVAHDDLVCPESWIVTLDIDKLLFF